MTNLKYFGILAGLAFGLVWVWQGVGAAFIVLSFALLGWLVEVAISIGRRAASGEINMEAVKQLISAVFSGARRS